eukprot:jgi/Mesvir1/1473/Mv14457-RA.1
MDELDKNGYVVLSQALTPQDVKSGEACIRSGGPGLVDYAAMETFIRTKMLRIAQQKLSWERADFTKFRVSDNNNSADAGSFHRDLVYQGREDPFVPPFYTCLAYFDSTVMELIPGSHRRVAYAWTELPGLYAGRIRMRLQPGDLLVFSSSLLHRGVFTENLAKRRLVQVFEVFRDANTRDLCVPRVLHVEGRETFSGFMIWASRGGVAKWVINSVGFANAARGYGVQFDILKRCGLERYLYFSSEGLRKRIEVSPGTWQPINQYIINKSLNLADLPAEWYATYNFYAFTRTHSLFLFVTALLLVFGILGAKRVIKLNAGPRPSSC